MKMMLSDSVVRQIYESRIPLRVGQKPSDRFKNVPLRSIGEKRAIVYKSKAKYLNRKPL